MPARGLAPPSDFGELPSTDSGPEYLEDSRAAAVLSPVMRIMEERCLEGMMFLIWLL